MKSRYLACSTVVALAAGLLGSTFATAQQAPVQTPTSDMQTKPDPAVPDNSTTDIIVTAQKRSERLRDVPLSITAASAEQLESRGITAPADLEKIVPGFTFSQSQNGTPVFSVRGVGFYSETVAAASTVTTYVDQTPFPFARMTAGAALDLERVEVLKGPQGTLFGANATAGAINYIAAKPTATPEGGASVTYGRFNQVDVGGYVSGPLTDTLTARVAVRSEWRDGWQKSSTRDESSGKRDFQAARLLLDWKPSSGVRFELNVNGWRDRSDVQIAQARGFLPVAPGPAVTPQTLATQTALINYSYIRSTDNRLTDWDPGRSRKRDDSFYQVALRSDVDVTDAIRLISLSSYTQMKIFAPIDADATNVRALTVDQRGRLKAFTQELRLEGESGPLKWIVGGNYQYSKSAEQQKTTLTGSNAQIPLPPTFTSGIFFSGVRIFNDQRVNSGAGFGNLDYEIAPRVKLQGGVRYTNETRKFNGCVADDPDVSPGLRVIYPFPTTPGQCLTLLPDGSVGEYFRTLKEDNLSWRGGINWKPSGDTLLYANVTKGYKSGDFGTLPGLDYRMYDPVTQESVLAYEGGLKTRLVDRLIDLSAAIFYYKYSDKQTQGQRNLPPFGNLPFLVNVPKSRIAGVEAEVTIRPMTGLKINLSGTFVDSKVDGSAIVASPFVPATVDARGDVLPNTPKWQGQADIEYSFPVNGSMRGFVGASGNARTQAYAVLGATRGPAGTQDFFRIDGYVLVDLRAGLEIDDRYTVQVFGRNVFNKDYWNNVVHIYDTYDRLTGQPATYGVTVSARF